MGYNHVMRRRLFVPSILIVATLSVFAPAVSYDFVSWDDGMFIYENPLITTPSAGNALHFWKEPSKGLYIPLTATAWSFLAWISQYMPAKPYGLNPGLFHGANLIVHLLGVLVVYSILVLLLTHGFREKE